MRGTRIGKEVEICATNLANKTRCTGTDAKKLKPYGNPWKNLSRHTGVEFT
jgi:hypothetical protein